jgi:hypothetical protein
MRDGLPCITFSFISSRMNFVQCRLHLSIINLSVKLESSPIPKICSGIHGIEPSDVCCANAVQPTSKYDVDVRNASTTMPFRHSRQHIVLEFDAWGNVNTGGCFEGDSEIDLSQRVWNEYSGTRRADNTWPMRHGLVQYRHCVLAEPFQTLRALE